ncbi:beta-1,3-galactosyltransferase 1-like isoform X2 [Neocloeon triangulifer]|uniref:beta-1,3-galactosyltransferase 1-like isoform X2 n=1 Tax=Neocloeon triangulifer TaxID=2078957 RepID=UPI00286ED18F|nr:beta-1,3-galactosyltransferase 1-like isoform X2 [Neocloeon triangulifer]
MSDDDAVPQRRLKTTSLQRVARTAATPRSVDPPEPSPLLTPYPLPALRKNKPPRYKHWMGRAYSRGQIYSALLVDNCNNVDGLADDTRLLLGDDEFAVAPKKSSFYAVCCIFLFLLVLLYIPVYYHVQVREAPVAGWERNSSRNLREYVQPDNVTAIIEQPSICASNGPILLLVIICSSVENFDARLAIRETWGSPANVSDETLRLAFLLGDTDSLELQTRVEAESAKYGDVIQEGFLDTYNNLTLKSVMLLKWVRSHCRHAQYVMKTDDDMYVNLPKLITFLQEDLAKFRPAKQPPAKPALTPTLATTALPDFAEAKSTLLVGTLICGARPISNSRSKWYSPKYMFPDRTYPKYLSGTGYVMSAQVVKRLYEAALRTPLFHLEDVYITGLCSKAAKIRPLDNAGFSYQKRKLEPCAYRNQLFTSHHMNSTDMRTVWATVQNPSLVCPKVVPTAKKPTKKGKKISVCV